MRKLWSGSNFKSTVSPQELAQELSVESKKRFSTGQRADCLDLLVWLMATLHKGLGKAATSSSFSSGVGGGDATSSSVVYEPFRVSKC
jgi:hypothetical protein